MPKDLEDGEVTYVQGSAATPYEIKNTGGVYSCTCPAWRHQSLGIEQRTCKHIKKIRGEAAEIARVGAAVAPPRSSSTADNPNKPPVLLAHVWESTVDLSGWWLSEKLDGVRAYWNGETFLSRLGNKYYAPSWFTSVLPNQVLDGELWVGRGEFQRTVSIVRRQDESELWREVSFLVFDAPEHGGVFEERIDWLKSTFGADSPSHVSVVDHARCEDHDQLHRQLAEIEAQGGEGLMARKPQSVYVAGRSHTLLKIKTFSDAEAKVVSHQAGKGRHKGRMGALGVVLPDGTQFSVGTGFSDKERENPPPIGTVITFRYQELSKDGVPRFPSYVGIRDDVSWPEDAASETGAKKATPPKKAAKPKAAPKPTAAGKKKPATKAAPATTPSSDGAQYFELSDGKSHKFWEITVEGTAHTVRYGRIGTNGTSKTKSFDSESAAQASADKLIRSKVGKGYQKP